ncbi:MAG: signal peptidase I [Patescibacteria group bacterium]|jgi:signal peptidase I
MEEKKVESPKKIPGQIPERMWPDWLKSSAGFFFETLKIVVISLAIILPIRFFLIQPFYVKGASMEPTFHDYEYLLIDEISYRFSEPQRGDIIVFHYPEDRSQYFIKRVIGLPGETIDVQDGSVVITPATPESSIVLDEPYLAQNIVTDCLMQYDCTLPITLGTDQYFALGDNRSASFDSRYFGALTQGDIVGKAWLRVWPFSTFTRFEPQSYSISL